MRFLSSLPKQPKTVMGFYFPHPISLAAGLDKNADCVDGLASLGFSFIEIGTVTPKPQAGNPRRRLFVSAQATTFLSNYANLP